MADNITTPVTDGTLLATEEVSGVHFPWNLIADAAGNDATGLVTASPAAFSVLGRLKTIGDLLTTQNGFVDGIEALQTTGNATLVTIAGHLDGVEAALAAATPAGENYTGKVGGDVLVSSVSPTVSTAAYAAGDVIGAKMTLTGAARLAAGAGLVNSVVLHAKTAQTAAVDLLIFSADPSASTFTDNAALSIAAGDFDKLAGVVHLTDWTALGTPSAAQSHGAGIAFKLASGTALYGVLVARAAITLGSTTDLTLTTRVIPG